MDMLQFPFITPFTYAASFTKAGCSSPLQQWLVYGRLPENPVVTPSTEVQVVRPSSANKYLASVTVEATTTTA